MTCPDILLYMKTASRRGGAHPYRIVDTIVVVIITRMEHETKEQNRKIPQGAKEHPSSVSIGVLLSKFMSQI